MRTRTASSFAAVFMLIALAAPAVAQGGPAVRGVLFFSPTCGHCEYVIQEVLPPLFDEHGGPWDLVFDETLPETDIAFYLLTNGTLQFLLVDVTIEAGSELFQDATDTFSIGSNGVPRLIVANQVMIGSADIPDRLPGLIVDGLAGEGIEWPALPGVGEIVASLNGAVATTSTTIGVTDTTAAPATTAGPTTTAPESIVAVPVGADSEIGFGEDPAGTAVAIATLVLLLAGLGWAVVVSGRDEMPFRPGALVPWAVLAGMVIASYLVYVEIGGGEAVCGPVGDCNVVQESSYSTVAGIPNGLLGLGGFLAIGVLWVVRRRGSGRNADLGALGLGLITVVGVAFSAWLTFAEAFLINATCAWCIGSALAILALMWLTLPEAVSAWRRLAPLSDVE